MTIVEFTALLGAITGSVSIGFLIYKAITNKPKLSFEIKGQDFYPPQGNNNFIYIAIRMKAHNKGSKSTTIYRTTLKFNHNSKPHKIEKDSSVNVSPNSTIDFIPDLNLRKNDIEIHDKITDCELTIDHTHDQNIINLGTIEEYKR